MACACILGTKLTTRWCILQLLIIHILADLRYQIAVYQLLLYQHPSELWGVVWGEWLHTWGMRHLLEPDRPGYVPSVSFLRPDRSEERGPLQIGIFDSASWQDSKQLQWQQCQKRNELTHQPQNWSEWRKMLKVSKRFLKPRHMDTYRTNHWSPPWEKVRARSPNKSLEPIQLEPNWYVKENRCVRIIEGMPILCSMLFRSSSIPSTYDSVTSV